MSRTAQALLTKFDFTAAKQPTFLADGTPTGGYAIVRTDENTVIGQNVSEGYGLIQNADAVSVVEDAFQSYGLNFTRLSRVLRGGAELAMTYDFSNRQIVVPRVGDVLGLRLTLLNSFDGSSPLAFQLGFLRLVCTNGMKSATKELALTKKHYGKVDLAFVKARLAEAIAKAENEAALFAAMAGIAITQREGENLIAQMVARGSLSGKLAAGILGVWQRPSYRQDEDRNLYNLYNAFTQYITRNVEQERFEMARRVQGTVTATFTRVTTMPSELTPMLLPAPKKED